MISPLEEEKDGGRDGSRSHGGCGAQDESNTSSSSSTDDDENTICTPRNDGEPTCVRRDDAETKENTGNSGGSDDIAPEETRTSMETALIVTALGSALFLAALDITIVTVAIPTITQEFDSTAGYTWIGSAYMLASAAGAPMWGKISDIWGRKPILLIAVGIFWVGSLMCALSKNMGMLIAVRAIQGLGGGGIIILVNICISDLFSMRKRGAWPPFYLPSLSRVATSADAGSTNRALLWCYGHRVGGR